MYRDYDCIFEYSTYIPLHVLCSAQKILIFFGLHMCTVSLKKSVDLIELNVSGTVKKLYAIVKFYFLLGKCYENIHLYIIIAVVYIHFDRLMVRSARG